MQLFNTDIHDKEDDQQFISKESKFFKSVNSVHVIWNSAETLLLGLYLCTWIWVFAMIGQLKKP